MIGPTPTRIRTLRYTNAQVLCTRCEICGAKWAPWGYWGRYYCTAHKREGEEYLAHFDPPPVRNVFPTIPPAAPVKVPRARAWRK